MKNAFLIASFFLVSLPANAMKFSNQFVEFDLPHNWSCAQNEAAWVCQSGDFAKKRDAVIVMAAKLRGEQDSMEKYEEFLRAAKPLKKPSGQNALSEPKYTRTTQFGGHPWVDSMHSDSEMPGYFTRYLATIKEDIGVVVTYSIAKAKVSEYSAQFENMVGTLRVFRKQDASSLAKSSGSLMKNVGSLGSFLPPPPDIKDPREGEPVVAEKPKPSKKSGDDWNLILLCVSAVVGGYLIVRKRR